MHDFDDDAFIATRNASRTEFNSRPTMSGAGAIFPDAPIRNNYFFFSAPFPFAGEAFEVEAFAGEADDALEFFFICPGA